MDYLIPANTKKSMLWFNLFRPIDAAIFGGSIILTFIFLLTFDINTLPIGLLAISPGLIGTFLVFPIPNYHNMITVIVNAYLFYTTRQKFVWKGWCVSDGENEK